MLSLGLWGGCKAERLDNVVFMDTAANWGVEIWEDKGDDVEIYPERESIPNESRIHSRCPTQ
jgi:hypothetical protein